MADRNQPGWLPSRVSKPHFGSLERAHRPSRTVGEAAKTFAALTRLISPDVQPVAPATFSRISLNRLVRHLGDKEIYECFFRDGGLS